MSLAAVLAGKSVFSEKPLALGLAEALALGKAADARGVRVGCAPDTFLGAGLQTCRKLVDDGAIGEPVAASGLGLTEYDERLDDLSADAFRARDASAAAFLARLDGIADEGLAIDRQLDRDLARSTLRGRLIMAPFEAWRRDPVTVAADAPLEGMIAADG